MGEAMAEPPDDMEARKAAIRAYKLAEAAEIAQGLNLDVTSDEERGFRKRFSNPRQVTSLLVDDSQAYQAQSVYLKHKVESPFSMAFRIAFGAAVGLGLFRFIVTIAVGLLLYIFVLSLVR